MGVSGKQFEIWGFKQMIINKTKRMHKPQHSPYEQMIGNQ